jgi:signal transduction histidine kinase/ligand-binding sensor domain-containing protein
MRSWYRIVTGCLFILFSCHHPTSTVTQNGAYKKPPVIKTARKELFVSPSIIYINPLHPARIVKAGKPLITIDSSNGGNPEFTNYSTDQGLTQSSVLCGACDKAGNLWFGTAGRGVCRFDGKNFTNYTIAQGLGSNVVLAVFEDKAGNLWFGTTAGVSKYDGYHITTYTIAAGLTGNFVSCIRQDSKGNLWFGTHERGVSRFDGKAFTNYAIPQGLAGDYVHCITEVHNGDLWFGTDGGVSRFDGIRFRNISTAQGLAGNSVNSIVEDRQGDLWFGTSTGVSQYNGKQCTNYTTAQGLADNNVSSIRIDRSGTLWFGTRISGISKFDGTRFINYGKAQGLAADHITTIVEDRAGHLWFTTIGGGVSRYDGNSLTNYPLSQSTSSHLVFSLMEGRAGDLWFGTYDEGVYKYDGRRFERYTTAQGLPDNLIWGMLADRSGNIWFGTDRGGASKFDGKTFTNYTTAQGLAGNTVNCIVQDKTGTIWFGTRGAGASRFDGQRFINYTTRQGLAGNTIQCILEDRHGNIWFGTHDNGVSKYDGQSFTNYTTAQGLGSNTVYNMIEDRKGNLWMGTNQGASKYDGKQFVNYSTGQRLADEYVWAIAEDTAKNIIWLGTNFGLSALKQPHASDSKEQGHERETKEQGHERETKEQGLEFEIFNETTGYRIKEVNSGAMFIDHKGIVWLGTAHTGLLRFDYNAVDRTPPPPPNLEILDVRINNENICWSDLLRRRNNAADTGMVRNEMMTSFGKILPPPVLDSIGNKYHDIRLEGLRPFYPVPTQLVLPFGYNNVTLDFAAIDPFLSKQVSYQYRLEGYNDDWSSPGNNTTAVFGNIPAGNYLFQLKAVSPFGGVTETEYPFRVLPPWWSTWWAYALYALSAGGILYAMYRNRIRSIERKKAAQISLMVAGQEDERRRISRDLHDDVGVKLSALRLILSSLHERSFATPDEEIRALAQSSENLLGETIQDVRQLLHNLSPGVLQEFGYITAVEWFIAKMNKMGPPHFTLVSFGMTQRLREDYELALYRITQELINNVIKHAEAKKASLQIGRRDGRIILMIEDDGKGFDPATQKEGYGLHNLDIRTRLMKGTMTVDSYPGKGTSVLIELPYNLPEI